jgi:predicted DNA-binding protein
MPDKGAVTMKSFRLSPELDARLRAAAKVEGVTVAEFMRRAIKARVEQVENETLNPKFSKYVGALSSDVLCADNTEEAFGKLLTEKQKNH